MGGLLEDYILVCLLWLANLFAELDIFIIFILFLLFGLFLFYSHPVNCCQFAFDN